MSNDKALELRLLCWTLSLAAACHALGCNRDRGLPEAASFRSPPPLAAVPVLCTEQPQGPQIAVTCRYYYQHQALEAWSRSIERASQMAVSLGFSHVQYINAASGVDVAPSRTPVECKQVPAWGVQYRCQGGDTRYSYTASYTTAYFAMLTAAEAAPRVNDPLIPPDRRPIDARQFLAGRAQEPSSSPKSEAPPLTAPASSGAADVAPSAVPNVSP